MASILLKVISLSNVPDVVPVIVQALVPEAFVIVSVPVPAVKVSILLNVTLVPNVPALLPVTAQVLVPVEHIKVLS